MGVSNTTLTVWTIWVSGDLLIVSSSTPIAFPPAPATSHSTNVGGSLLDNLLVTL